MQSAENLVQAVHLTAVKDQLVAELSHGQQRQLEIALALAGAPRFILFDEPAAGLSPTERARADRDPHLAARAYRLHHHRARHGRRAARGRERDDDAQRPHLQGRPPGGDRDPIRRCRSFISGAAMAEHAAPRAAARRCAASTSTMGIRTRCRASTSPSTRACCRDRRPQRHGQDHAVQDHHGPGARVERLDPLRPERRAHRGSIRRRSPGSASATCRRAGGCGARSPSTSICALDRRTRAGAPGPIERIYDTFPRLAERRRTRGGAALRRRAADARDLARAARQSAPAGHGRADRGPCAGDRRAGRGDAGAPRRGRRDGGARDRAEHRRGARAVSENVAIMVNGRDQPRDRRRAPRRRPRRCSSACWASAGMATTTRRSSRAGPRDGGDRSAPQRSRAGADADLRLEPDACRRAGRSRCRSRGSRLPPASAAASIVSLDEVSRNARRDPAARCDVGPPVVLVAGTLDTKGEELRFIRDLIEAGAVCARGSSISPPAARHSGRRRRPPHEVALQPRPRRLAACSPATAAHRSPRWRRRSRPGSRARAASPASSRPAARARPRWSTPGDAAPARRRAEGHDLDRRVGRCRPLRRPGRHHDDVFGHRRAGPECDLAPGAFANGAQAMAGMVKARLAATREARAPARRAPPDLPAIGLTMFGVTTPCVQQLTAALARRIRLPRVPRHRRRRPVDGEAGRRRPVRGRHRHHHDRGVRPPDGRRVSGRPKTASARSSARACPMSARSARSTWSTSAPRDTVPARYQRPACCTSAQSAGHADAHHAGRERADRDAGSASG